MAIVTGAAGGLGRETAKLFAAHQANVACFDRDSSGLGETVAQIAAAGGQAKAVETDLDDLANLVSSFWSVNDSIGPPSILVNNAAIYCRENWRELAADGLARSATINLSAPILLIQQFAICCERHQERRGVAVNVLSDSALKLASRIAYASTKAGLAHATRCLAKALMPLHVRVNGICPGLMDTDMAASIPASERDELLSGTFTGKLIEPSVVAHRILELVDPKNEHITGSILNETNGLWI